MPTEFINKSKLSELVDFKNLKIEIYEELKSTNMTAKEFAESGADEGLLIVAQQQTQGRGRLGRTFYSPNGTGLYFSLVLRPDLSPDDTTILTPIAAVAVSLAFESLLNKKAKIKWVNDVFCDGKKVCGILCESKIATDKDGVDFIVLGVGINLFNPKEGFPKDIENIAGALCQIHDFDLPTLLLAEILNNFFYYYKNIKTENLYEEYNSRLMLKGITIKYLENGLSNTGTVVGVDRNFRLIIKTDSGEMKYLSSGEVTMGSGQL